MPSRIRKDARAKNAVLKTYQEIASRKNVKVAERLMAADRLAAILGLFPEAVTAQVLQNPNPTQIEFAVPQKDLESTVEKMLNKIEENRNADTLRETAGSGELRQELQS